MLWSLTMQVYSTNTQNVRRGGRGLLTAAICTQAVVHTGAMINGCTSFQFSAFQLYFILVYTYTVIFLRINFVTFCKMFCLFFNHFCAYNSRKKLINSIPYGIYFKNQLLFFGKFMWVCRYKTWQKKHYTSPWVFPTMIARFIAHT